MRLTQAARDRLAHEFANATRQRREVVYPRGLMAVTEAEERRYHVAMARLCEERGWLNMADSHLVLAADCPKTCNCIGCENTRADADEARARKDRKLRVVRGGLAA